MILDALAAGAKGRAPRFGPSAFPTFDFGTPLKVPTPHEGGDGKATNPEEAGIRKDQGTMPETSNTGGPRR